MSKKVTTEVKGKELQWKLSKSCGELQLQYRIVGDLYWGTVLWINDDGTLLKCNLGATTTFKLSKKREIKTLQE